MANDIKDSSIDHSDDELDFHEFEAFDDPSHSKDGTSSASASVGFGGGNHARSFDHLQFGSDSRGPLKIVIIVVVIVCILGFIIYHFMGKSSLTALHEKRVATPATVTAPPPTVNTVLQDQEQQTVALTTKVAAVDQTLSQQQQTINQIQANMGTLQDSVNSLNSTVSTVSQQLTTLDEKIAKPVVAKKTAANLPPAPPPVTYVIKAMVPGRAWLLASTGSLLSVAVGNAVPDHGVVNQIDLNSGQVFMSDGSVFVYDLNGN